MKTMKTQWLVAAIAVALQPIVNLQYAVSQNVGINYTGASPNGTALLDIDIGTGTARGLLIPRMTAAQRDGIASPARGLMVFVTTDSAFYYNNGAPASPNWVRFMAGSGSAGGWSLTGNAGTTSATNFLGTTDNVSLRFRTNNVERMYIDSATGNVGIGTTTPGPTSKLHVVTSGGGSTLQLESYITSTGIPSQFIGKKADGTVSAPTAIVNADEMAYFGAQGYNGSAFSWGALIAMLATQNWDGINNGAMISFATVANGTTGLQQRMVIYHNGNVGIGTPTPNSKFELRQSTEGLGNGLRVTGSPAGTNQDFIEIYASTDNFTAIQSKWDQNALVGNLILNPQGGNVGIGATSPGGLLELSLDQGRKPSTNTWTIVSDERLKNVQGSYQKGLNEVLQLQPLTYYYKNAGERTFKEEVLRTLNVGFSAQEVQKIFPEAVGVDPDGYLNFNMHAILVAYTNAIKELKAENDALKEELNEAKAELKAATKQNSREIAEIKILLGTSVKK